MYKITIQSDYGRSNRNQRRGVVAVYVAVCGVVIIGFAALAVDIGMLYATQAEMQRCADAAAMAATWELLGEDRLLGGEVADALEIEAREMAVYAAGENIVHQDAPIVNQNEDVDVGYVSDLSYNSNVVFSSAEASNAVRVRVQRDNAHGGSISLYFARLFGADNKDLQADAVAAFEDGVFGYKITNTSGNAELLPFTLHIDTWNGLLAGTTTTGDNYTYDPDTGAVYEGPDGILELNFYPGDMNGQLPPGNFGTVDIGPDNNSARDVRRQILEGISEEDLSYFGGELTFGPDGTFELNGDNGTQCRIQGRARSHHRATTINSDLQSRMRSRQTTRCIPS